MKRTWKYLAYELKKNIWAFVVLTVVCTLPYVSTLSSMDVVEKVYMETANASWRPANPQLTLVFIALLALCFLSPVLVFSFKMNKRGVDGFYALPLKREKLYFAKTLTGLALVLVPFTVAYWSGFFTLLCRENTLYQTAWYLPAYFGAVGYGVLLFGFNSFAFTRANKVSDGVAFMLGYAFLFSLIASYLEYLKLLDLNIREMESFLSFGGMMNFCDAMESRVCGYTVDFSALSIVVPLVLGCAGYALLFLLLRYEKGENAEQISESPFGYKALIPLYLAFAIGCGGLDELTFAAYAVAAVVATIVYRRKFRFSWRWWVMLGGALVLGLVLNAFAPNPWISFA